MVRHGEKPGSKPLHGLVLVGEHILLLGLFLAEEVRLPPVPILKQYVLLHHELLGGRTAGRDRGREVGYIFCHRTAGEMVIFGSSEPVHRGSLF